MTKTDVIKENFFKNPEFNRAELARKLKVDEAYIRRVIRPLRKEIVDQGYEVPKEKIEFNKTSKNNATLDLQSITINTLEKALEIAEVDMTQWKVDRYEIGSWQVTMKLKTETGDYDTKGRPIMYDKPKTVTMYRIRVWLKKLHNMEWVEAIRLLVDDLPTLKTPKKKYSLDGNYLLEVALFDVHFGMLAWGKETGTDYDIDIAEDLFLKAVQDLLAKSAGYTPSQIIFPFGNDFLHIDDPTNQTPTNRNLLDADSRLIKIYQKAKKSVIKAVNYCREVAPVHVCWVPGNHDPMTSYYLCDVLSHVFDRDEYVSVDISPKLRKYYPWGQCLIGYTHGLDEPLRDLPSIMATEEPMLWGNSKYREIHIGHKHKKMQMHWVNVDTMPGTVIRMIPSIAGTDAWHFKRGYVKSYNAAESYIWDADHGVVGQFTSFVNHISV